MMNTLADEHKNEKHQYVDINPSGQIPTILEGSYKILGGNNAQLTYLCSTHRRVGEALCPVDGQRVIMGHLNWFQRKMRPCTSRLITMLTNSYLNQDSGSRASTGTNPEASIPDGKQQQMVDEEKRVFFDKLLPPLNEKLRESPYFGGRLSIADL